MNEIIKFILITIILISIFVTSGVLLLILDDIILSFSFMWLVGFWSCMLYDYLERKLG